MLALFVRIQLTLSRVLDAQDGQELVEYAMVLFFLTVLLLAATRFLGSKVLTVLTTVANSI